MTATGSASGRPGACLRTLDDNGRVPIRFRIFCVAAQMYLYIGDERGGAITLTQMEGRGEGRWELTLRMRPATYLYHYFADHGGVITYASPREVDDMPTLMDGMSAVLVVPAPPEESLLQSAVSVAPFATAVPVLAGLEM
jgi:hypothetical protein